MFIHSTSRLEDVIKELPKLTETLENIKAAHDKEVVRLKQLMNGSFEKLPMTMHIDEYKPELSTYDVNKVLKNDLSTIRELEVVLGKCTVCVADYSNYIKSLEHAHEVNTEWRQGREQLRENVVKLLTSLGLKEKETYRKSAGSSKTYQRYSPWYTAVCEAIQVNDGHHSRISSAKSTKNDYQRLITDIEYKIRSKKSIAEQQEKTKKLESTVGTASILFNIDSDSPHGVCHRLRESDKYLNLAYQMERARNYFAYTSDVYEWLQSGAFTVENEVDQQILDSLLELCEGDTLEDGRIFIHCEWNFTRIYELADNTKLQVHNNLRELLGGFNE